MNSLWSWQKRAVLLALAAGGAWWTLPAAEKPPVAEKKPTVDEYQGTPVTDDYQWLEKAEDPAVKGWVAAENKVTRDYLDALPDRKGIAAKLTELYGKVTPRYFDLVSRPAGLFALKFQPPKQQPMLVLLPSADAAAPAEVRPVSVTALQPRTLSTDPRSPPSRSNRLVK